MVDNNIVIVGCGNPGTVNTKLSSTCSECGQPVPMQKYAPRDAMRLYTWMRHYLPKGTYDELKKLLKQDKDY